MPNKPTNFFPRKKKRVLKISPKTWSWKGPSLEPLAVFFSKVVPSIPTTSWFRGYNHLQKYWIGSSAQVGVKIKSLWNNHLAYYFSIAASSFCSLYRCTPCCLLPQASVGHLLNLRILMTLLIWTNFLFPDPVAPKRVPRTPFIWKLLGGTVSTHLFKNNHPNYQVGVHKLAYQPQLTIQSQMSDPSNAGV